MRKKIAERRESCLERDGETGSTGMWIEKLPVTSLDWLKV